MPGHSWICRKLFSNILWNNYYKRINNTEEEGFNLADICFSLGDIYCGLKEGECRNCMIPIAIWKAAFSCTVSSVIIAASDGLERKHDL